LENSETTVIKTYVSNLLSNQVLYLENQMEGVLYDGNIEFLHHTRVMCRRIRNTLSVFTPFLGKKSTKRWMNSLKKLTKSLTEIRDLDVQIKFLENKISNIADNKFLPGLQRLHLRKVQQRDKKQDLVRGAILRFEKEGTISEMKSFVSQNPFSSESFTPPDSLKIIASEKIEELIKVCFTFVPFITNLDQSAALHNFRIALKNLRYTTELFLPIHPDLSLFLEIFKKFQDDLGEIHDCDVWISDLNKFLEKEKLRITKFYGQTSPFNFIRPGIIYLLEDVTKLKKDRHEKFLDKWNYHFQNQLWTNLSLVFTQQQSSNII